jgi:hypothetical protein
MLTIALKYVDKLHKYASQKFLAAHVSIIERLFLKKKNIVRIENIEKNHHNKNITSL